jgi:hypothetical protein
VKLQGLAMTAALSLLSPAALAAGETQGTEERDVARVVEIRVNGDATALARVRVTARELLRRLDVQANVKAIDEPETTGDEPDPMVIAYVDLRSPTSPSIDIQDGASRQELTRRTLSDASSLETGVEGVLHVLYLAVESRLQLGAARLAPPPSPIKKPAPPEPPRVAQPSRLGFDLGPMFRVSSLGGTRVVPGGGVALEPRLDWGRNRAGLLLSGAAHATSELGFDHGLAEVRPLQVRAVPTLDWPISSDVSGCVGLGAGVDMLTVTPTQAPDSGVARSPATGVDPVLTGMLGARVPIAGRVFLSALASLDLDLAPTAFVARAGQDAYSILRLPRVRAGFSLALSFTAAGSRRFPALAVEQ